MTNFRDRFFKMFQLFDINLAELKPLNASKRATSE